jgi:hypothetical protein
MADRHNANKSKWSDDLGAKLLYILGILFVLLFLAALFSGEIEGGFGGVNTYEIDTLPDVAP